LRAHVEQVDEEIVRQRLGRLVKTPCMDFRHLTQDAQAAYEDRHFRRGQLQQLRPVTNRSSADRR